MSLELIITSGISAGAGLAALYYMHAKGWMPSSRTTLILQPAEAELAKKHRFNPLYKTESGVRPFLYNRIVSFDEYWNS